MSSKLPRYVRKAPPPPELFAIRISSVETVPGRKGDVKLRFVEDERVIIRSRHSEAMRKARVGDDMVSGILSVAPWRLVAKEEFETEYEPVARSIFVSTMSSDELLEAVKSQEPGSIVPMSQVDEIEFLDAHSTMPHTPFPARRGGAAGSSSGS